MSYIAISEDAPVLRGGALELWKARDYEVMLTGPYNTGKTFGALYKLHALLCVHPGSRALMVRKTYKSAVNSIVVTYEQKVLPVNPHEGKSPIKPYGGERPEFYQYPNGSRLIVGGMDNPDKFLSAEYDFIYTNQSEELSLDDWEKLTGRATGRAGNAPWTQVFGDCNPDIPYHWIQQRKPLKKIESRHEDNPTLYQDGKWTELGKKTLSILDRLTGVRYKRGRLGLWVAAEGQVYESFDPAIHVINRFEIPASWRRFRLIDFGYRNPFVCQWWALSDDDRLYRYREIYMSGRTVGTHAKQINELSQGEKYAATICDHDAEDRATLAENGIETEAATKTVKRGIEKVEERLGLDETGKPAIYFLRDSLVEVDESLRADRKPICTEDEFISYVWPKGKDGQPEKEEPVKENDHGMDAMRYMVMKLDGGGDADVADLSQIYKMMQQ